MSRASQVGRAILWSQLGRIAEVGLFFLFSLFLARTLGPQSYGIYALGLSVAALCGFLTLLGIGPETLGKFLPEVVARSREHGALALLQKLLVLRVGAIAGAVVIAFVCKDWIAREFRLPWLVGSLGLVLILFAVRSVYDLLTYFSSGLLELRRVALAKVIAALAALAIFLLFFLLDRVSVQSALAATAGGYAFGVILLAALVRRLGSAEPRAGPGEAVSLRRILQFGLFAWMTNFFLFVLSDGADVLLVSWLLKDPAAVGYYAVASKLVFRLTSLLLGWLPLVTIPAFSHAYLEGGAPGLAAAAQAQWKLVVLSLTAPLLLLFRYASEMITLFYSAAYSASVPVMQILCGLMACGAVFGFSLQTGILYALNRERLACAIVAAAALFNIVAGILLIQQLGMNGAAWATGLSFAFFSILSAAVGAFFVPLRVPWQFILKVVAAGLMAVVSTLWLHPASIAALGAACALWGIVFLFCLAILKPLSGADSASLRRVNPQLGSLAERLFMRADTAPEANPIT